MINILWYVSFTLFFLLNFFPVDLFGNATKSIDIAIPSISSWLYDCAGYVDDDEATCAPGCSPEEQREETFPIFPALLNALHRGVSVRLLTNDYNYPDCEGISTYISWYSYAISYCRALRSHFFIFIPNSLAGTITQLQFLQLNGADVRYYTTTTYIHGKENSSTDPSCLSFFGVDYTKHTSYCVGVIKLSIYTTWTSHPPTVTSRPSQHA